jgi:hypothetical protein
MPIFYDKETDAWEAKDLSEDEKQSLVRSAKESIINYFGEEIADRILSQVGGVKLADIPQDQRGTA